MSSTMSEEDPKRAIRNALARLQLQSDAIMTLIEDGRDRAVFEAMQESIDEETAIIERALESLTIVCA